VELSVVEGEVVVGSELNVDLAAALEEALCRGKLLIDLEAESKACEGIVGNNTDDDDDEANQKAFGDDLEGPPQIQVEDTRRASVRHSSRIDWIHLAFCTY